MLNQPFAHLHGYRSAYSYPYPYPYPAFRQTEAAGVNGAPFISRAMPQQTPSGTTLPSSPPSQSGVGSQEIQIPGQLPMQQSFIENILRLNLGKKATIYMTFENNKEWNAKVFKGVLEAAGRDHIIISEPSTGKRFLLLMVNLDYITFDEPLNYTYPYHTSG